MDFNELKNKVDLIAYLSRDGYKKDPKKSSSRQFVFNGPYGDKLLVLKHSKSGDLIYKNLHDDNDYGNIINLVANRIEGFVNTSRKTSADFAKAADVLKEFLNIPKEDKIILDKINHRKAAVFKYENYNPQTLHDTSYLESRGITKKILDDELLKGTIINCQRYSYKSKSNYGSLMTGFPCTKEGQMVGLDMRDPEEKLFAAGSKKAESFWSSHYQSHHKNVVVGESPIDLISYQQIKGGKDNFLLSTNGTISYQQINMIVDMIQKGTFKRLISSFDNDFAGYTFDLKLIRGLIGEDKVKLITARKDYLEAQIKLKGLTAQKYEITSILELKALVNKLIASYQLEPIYILDKAPGKDWNELIDTSKKKSLNPNNPKKMNTIENNKKQDPKKEDAIERSTPNTLNDYKYDPKDIAGELIHFGWSNYKHEEGGEKSYFLQIKDHHSQKERTLWAKDFSRNIEENNIHKGDFIKITYQGFENVEVKVKQKGKDGNLSYKSIPAKRKTYDVQTIDKKDYISKQQAYHKGIEKKKQQTSSKMKGEESALTSKEKEEKVVLAPKAIEVSNRIPKQIQGVNLSKEDQERLADGETILLKNMVTNNGIMDGSVELKPNKDGVLSPSIAYARPSEVIIKDKILKYKLSKEEKQHLENGKVLGPLELDKDFKAYLQVDKAQNRVVIKTEKEIGVPKTIGGYALSYGDKNRLANGEKMLPRVFKGKHGYFMANVNITKDKTGLEYSNIVALSNQEAIQMMDSINSKTYSNELILENIVGVTKDMKTQGKSQESNKEQVLRSSENTEKTKLKIDVALSEKLKDRIKNNDSQGVGEILSKGFNPTEEHQDLIKTLSKEGVVISDEIKTRITTKLSTEKNQSINI
ncbi:DUF3945 domain-containing protein [Plebeiibacterium sediminum]|uniref:DUF3945 domain-containing protein n=1 Tax=Plebeiibacterium sediminum TaxID=2992112 RepID=A0AAE3M7C4_9BACT|nr:DUF3945 domain-containing protein [Plebeiobacterium sediminum]MCW3788362.1 DUF3945 domain-containing protein [Plebeiobacterium sediminum]